MGEPREPEPAKLFMSLIASEEDVVDRALADLRLRYGDIDFLSERFPFDLTDYYTREMGTPLFRHFVTFETLIAMSELPGVKQVTHSLERKFSRPDRTRRINIDPGYLCLAHVILATTKGSAHRPYLREGIYADLTLIYRNRSFQPLEWTYPDYRQDRVISLFNQFRRRYRDAMKGKEGRRC